MTLLYHLINNTQSTVCIRHVAETTLERLYHFLDSNSFVTKKTSPLEWAYKSKINAPFDCRRRKTRFLLSTVLFLKTFLGGFQALLDGDSWRVTGKRLRVYELSKKSHGSFTLEGSSYGDLGIWQKYLLDFLWTICGHVQPVGYLRVDPKHAGGIMYVMRKNFYIKKMYNSSNVQVPKELYWVAQPDIQTFCFSCLFGWCHCAALWDWAVTQG